MKTPLKALIIDDEKGSIKSLEWELSVFSSKIEVISTTQDPEQGLQILHDQKPDILFLDIEMPGMNGFQFLEKASPITTDVIFTTAYDEFAIRAFEVSALDYLLKPVTKEELERVLAKIEERADHDLFNKQLEFLLQHMRKKDPQFRTIVVPALDSLEFVEVDTIIRFEADSNYTKIFRTEGPVMMVSKTLKSLEQMVNGMDFFRIHNSHLVNIRFIKKLLRGEKGAVVLKDDTCLPVSRNRRADFLKRF